MPISVADVDPIWLEREIDRDDCPLRELVDGEWVDKNRGAYIALLCGHIIVSLGMFLREKEAGSVLSCCATKCFPKHPNTIRRPDICWVRPGRYPNDELPQGYLDIAPDLVIEIVTPEDTIGSFDSKVDGYFHAGVKEMWVVYPNTKGISIQKPDGTGFRFRENSMLKSDDLLPGFSLKVAEIFE